LCFGCGKEGHFIAEFPNIKVRRKYTNKNDKNKKKEVGEAHLGEEWDSNDDSSDSDDEVGLAAISIGEPINKPSLFEDLTVAARRPGSMAALCSGCGSGAASGL
jgi:hypothetical protein